jgi:5-methylcytosine-specific restriction endonuclease McrA
METKICSKCKEEKSIDNFYKRKASLDGLCPICKTCDSIRSKIRYSNPKHRKDTIDRVKQYYKENSEVIMEYHREFYKDNREAIRKQHLLYSNTHVAETKERSRKAYLANPSKYKASCSRRRGRVSNAEGTYSARDILLISISQDNLCPYCGCNITLDKHIDHILPLILGGTNWPQNLQTLCPTCNLRKGPKHPDVYEKEIRFDRVNYELNYARPAFGEIIWL